MKQSDINVLAQSFRQNGYLVLKELLPEELATALYQEFDSLGWKLQIKDENGSKPFEVPVSEISNRNNLIGELYSNKHNIDLDKLFFIRLVVDIYDTPSENMQRVINFLNSDHFINKCKQIVGIDDLTYTVVKATCFDKGCFLSVHHDDHDVGNRVAYVINLTPKWRIGWGGLLMLIPDPKNQPIIIPPGWNSLHLFRIPVEHTVTCVSQAATRRRYALSGWLR